MDQLNRLFVSAIIAVTTQPSVKTAVISMVKNEIDIIDAWISHAVELFDFVFIADHLSSDGTREYLRRRAQTNSSIKVLSYDYPEFDKADVLNKLREIIINTTNAEWLLVLDPDEFLPYGSRQEYHDVLEAEESSDFVRLLWRNCYSAQPGPVALSFKGYRQVRPSRIGKVVVRRVLAADPAYAIPLGAHYLVHRTGGKVQGKPIGELYHIPIRSLQQLWAKLLKGTINRLKVLAVNDDTKTHWHYIDMLNSMISRPSWEAVPSIVYDYASRVPDERQRLFNDPVELRKQFEAFEFQFAGDSLEQAKREQPAVCSPTTLPLHEAAKDPACANLISEVMKLDRDGLINFETALSVSGEGALKHLTDLSAQTFAALGKDAPTPLSVEDVYEAIEVAFMTAEAPAGTAWGEHIAFLNSLISLVRPRLLVAIGGQGDCFLAACHAAQRLQTDCRCVSINDWRSAAPGSFRRFRHLLAENYGAFAGHIDAKPDDVKNFAEGSIDLLLVDGSMARDFGETDLPSWIDRLSDRGVVLLNEINDHEDRRVSKLWRQIRDKYPVIEFGHGGGLGVLVVGESSPLRKAIVGWRASLLSPEITDLLQSLYCRVGQLPRKLAQRARDPNAIEDGDFRDRIARLETQLRSYEKSTSWRLTKPIRTLGRLFGRG